MNRTLAKTLVVSIVAMACLTSCSKNGEIQEFIKENDSLAAELKAKADVGPDEVTKALAAKVDGLKAKYAGIKGARGFQVSKENQAALMSSVSKGTLTVCGLSLKAIGDAEKRKAFDAACKTYTGIFK